MNPKFNIGDKVEIINYGDVSRVNEILWIAEANLSYKLNEASEMYIFLGRLDAYDNMDLIPDKYKTIEETGVIVLERDGNWITIDTNPEYIGEKGIVVEVDTPKDGRRSEYSLSGTTKRSWFYEDQLQLL